MLHSSRALSVFVMSVLAVCIASGSVLATCTGADPCYACNNCKYCAHCAKRGGTCGVCKTKEGYEHPV
jgi:hypothetical protein